MSDVPEWEKKLIEFYQSDKKSALEIGVLLGCSYKTVYYWLEKHGIKRRNYKEACANINKGSKNPMYGKSKHLSPTFGVKRPNWKIRGEAHWAFGKRGQEAAHWKPPHERRSTLYNALRASTKYKEWRSAIFKRDEFACIICKDSRGGNLNADHIKQFALIIKEHQIRTVEEGFSCQELWCLENGRTLCEGCHEQTETFGRHINDKKA